MQTSKLEPEGFSDFCNAWAKAGGKRLQRKKCLDTWVSVGAEAERRVIVKHIQLFGNPEQLSASQYIRSRAWGQTVIGFAGVRESVEKVSLKPVSVATLARETKDREARDKLVADRLAHPVGAFDTGSDIPEAVTVLANASEVSLDTETTGLTLLSVPVTASPAGKIGGDSVCNTIRKYQGIFEDCTVDTTLRPRIISFATRDSRPFAFDLDKLTDDERVTLVAALHNKVWVGHNLSFDLGWLKTIVPDIEPEYIIDTMLIGLTHAPEIEMCVRDAISSVYYVACDACPEYVNNQCVLRSRGAKCAYGVWERLNFKLADEDHYSNSWPLFDQNGDVFTRGRSGEFLVSKKVDPSLVTEVQKFLAQRSASANRDSMDSKGLPLNFLSMVLLHEQMDKSFQKPLNWTLSVLSKQHYEYCIGDITQPPKIARILLGLPEDATTQVLRSALEKPLNGSKHSTYRIINGGVKGLAVMQHNGMGMSKEKSDKYRGGYLAKAEELFNELVALMPTLSEFRDEIMRGGRTDALKTTLAQAFYDLTGVACARTDTGAISITASSLKLLYPDLPALKKYLEIGAVVKKADMADKYLAMSDAQGRLHSLVTVSAVTCRTTSQEPNLQNCPRGQDFRELFVAKPGHKLIASDYSAIEMRIAAALTVRAYRTLRDLVSLSTIDRDGYNKLARKNNLTWLMGSPGHTSKNGSLSVVDAIAYLIKHQERSIDAPQRVPRPNAGDPLDAWGGYYTGEMYRLVDAMWVAGAFRANEADDRLTLLNIFAGGLDPHIITAVATEVSAGRYDIAGMLPLDYVSQLSQAQREELKTQLKQARQSAKAQNFGLLYGMAGAKLHTYGIVSYGLKWTMEEAQAGADAWFNLYPEVGLWHLMTRFNNIKVNDYSPTEIDTPNRKRKVFLGTTLTNRRLVTERLPSALNFQDQGTGAEIALLALGSLPADLRKMLVNFVHDEFVLEAADEDVGRVKALLEHVMIKSADAVLGGYGVPTEVETSVGDHWIH